MSKATLARPATLTPSKIIIRTGRLVDLGLRWDGRQFYRGDFNIHWTEICLDNDARFEQRIERLKAELVRREAL